MKPLKVLVLDLETLRNADEVGGWGMAPLMGISVLVFQPILLYHTKVIVQPLQTFIEPVAERKQEIVQYLREADVLVSHNGMSFDYRVLAGELRLYQDFRKSLNAKTIDFCFVLRLRHGLNISLTNVATRTLGEKAEKAVPGEKIVEYWRSGDPEKQRAVIQHCMDDVDWTTRIFLKMLHDTKWKNKKSPSGRIKYFNPDEAEKRRNGGVPTRRITSSAVIPYPRALKDFLVAARAGKKKRKNTNKPVISVKGLFQDMQREVIQPTLF